MCALHHRKCWVLQVQTHVCSVPQPQQCALRQRHLGFVIAFMHTHAEDGCITQVGWKQARVYARTFGEKYFGITVFKPLEILHQLLCGLFLGRQASQLLRTLVLMRAQNKRIRSPTTAYNATVHKTHALRTIV